MAPSGPVCKLSETGMRSRKFALTNIVLVAGLARSPEWLADLSAKVQVGLCHRGMLLRKKGYCHDRA